MAEMIRSYNQVSTSLPRSAWRRRLTPLQKALWDDLVSWPTYCGLFSLDIEERAWYHGVQPAEITEALARFESEGKVKVSGTFVWVLDFISHQSFNPNLRKAAASELQSLEPRTSLASEALANLSGTLPIHSPILDKTRLDDTIQAAKPKTPAQPALLEDITELERTILKELQEIPTHPYDYKKDLDQIRKLAVDFPSVDLLATAKIMAAWLTDHPGKKSGRLRLRIFCETASQKSPSRYGGDNHGAGHIQMPDAEIAR